MTRPPGPSAHPVSAFHRYLTAPMSRKAVRGDGVYVIDSAGKRYLDGSSGSGMSSLGHSHAAVRQAMRRQLDEIAFANTSFFTNEPMERLAANLAADAPGSLDYVWFTSSGAEGVEAAVKLTRQYFIEIGEPAREVFIGRRGGYLGSSLAALAIGGNEARRQAFAPLLLSNVAHIGPCFPYRGLRDGETLAGFAERTAGELEAAIQTAGPSRVAAFMAETVVGSTLGAVAAPEGYFKSIRRICDRYGVLLILDEVMCGMGRVGSKYACTQEGIAPDMIVLGKALAGGYAPLGAVVIGAKIHDALRSGSGAFRHGHSAHGHALACAAGLAVQEEIARGNLLGNVERMGRLLERLLQERFGSNPHLGDIRGRGLMWAIELVEDPRTRRPFDPPHRLHARIKAHALELGLMCYPSPGTIDGQTADQVLLMPPFIVEPVHLEELVSKLERAVANALKEVPGASS